MAKLTADALHEMGSCYDYVERIQRLFPANQYPNGIEMDRATCVRHADRFDWPWAAVRMLNENGERQFNDLVYRSRGGNDEYGDFGTSERNAAIFSALMDNPENHSDRYINAMHSAEERQDRALLRRLKEATQTVEYATGKVTHWTSTLEQAKTVLETATEAATGATVREAKRRIETATANITAQETALENARRELAEAEAAQAALAATETSESTDETPIEDVSTTTDDTTNTDATTTDTTTTTDQNEPSIPW